MFVCIDKIVKIWFSKPDGHPLGGALNEYRLISHRMRFPKDSISLISNYEDLAHEQQVWLKTFTETYNIQLISVKTMASKIQDPQNEILDIQFQLHLLDIANAEISEDFVCLAAASDVVRVLSPVSDLGVYADFDVIKLESESELLRKLPMLDAPQGVLLSGNFSIDKDTNQPSVDSLCNNFFGCNERYSSFLLYYRQLVLERYTNKEYVDHIVIDFVQSCIIEPNDYKKALAFMKDNADDLSHLCYALQFRCALKACASELNFEKYLMASVLAISGPDCMNDAFIRYFQEEFTPDCIEKKLTTEEVNKRFLKFKLDYPMHDQDDVSWLKSGDSTGERFANIQSSVVTLQSFFRMKIAQNELKQLKIEEKSLSMK